MAHTIEPGPLPSIVIMTAYGDVETSDFVSPEALGLDQGPRYLLLDASGMTLGLPEGFMDGARQTPLTHPNCLHAAIVVRSELLKNLIVAMVKLARVRDKVTLFARYDEALNHLVALAQKTAGR